MDEPCVELAVRVTHYRLAIQTALKEFDQGRPEAARQALLQAEAPGEALDNAQFGGSRRGRKVNPESKRQRDLRRRQAEAEEAERLAGRLSQRLA